MLTDSDVSLKVFSDALSKCHTFSSHKWFKYSEVNIPEVEENLATRYRIHNMHNEWVEKVLENLEVLKKCEGPNTKIIRKSWEKIQALIDEVHPSQFNNHESINEIGRSLEYITDAFLE